MPKPKDPGDFDLPVSEEMVYEFYWDYRRHNQYPDGQPSGAQDPNLRAAYRLLDVLVSRAHHELKETKGRAQIDLPELRDEPTSNNH